MAQRRLIREIEATKSDEEVEQYYQTHRNSQYSALRYNCEHFAYECATGQKQSPTVRGYVVTTIIAAIGVAAIYLARQKR